MENLFEKKVPFYYETEEAQLILGDSLKILAKMKPESVDMIFADPPYFLSNYFILLFLSIIYEHCIYSWFICDIFKLVFIILPTLESLSIIVSLNI